MMDEYEMMYEMEEQDYPDEIDYYEDWDHIEIGFDPYAGCYTDDC